MSEPVYTLSEATRADVSLRLRRIEGQVRGIQRMVEEGRDCREIVHQIAAIKAALNSATSAVLQCYAHSCFEDGETANQRVAELIEMMVKNSK